MHGRFVKIALEVNNNTFSYVWKMDAGKHGVKVEDFRRAGR